MKRFWLAASVLALGLAGTAFAAPFQNGGFETGGPVSCGGGDNLTAGSTVIPGWTVSVGSVDWATACNWTSQEGSHSLDLIGGGATAVSTGGVQQTFDTVPGATYQVSFYLAANPSTSFGPVVKPLTVTVDGIPHNYAFDSAGHTSASMGWTQQTFSFVAGGSSSTISFVSDLGALTSFAGPALDNVSITQLNAWTGSAGSVTNPGGAYGVGRPYSPPYLGTPIPSSPTVVSNGTAGASAEFTYQTVNSFCCHTGDWTFETPVTTDGDVRRNWTYAGYHGTCSAVATLLPYVRHLGVTTFGTPLYNQADNCSSGLLPSGGFGDGGQVDFTGLVNGDSYGFLMHASNYDSNGGVGGRLTVTTGTSPTTTALGSSSNPVVLPGPIDFTATVTGGAPTGHVTFTQEGREIGGCIAIPLVGNTAVCSVPSWFAGPTRAILALYSGDSVNARSASPPLLQATSTVPLGLAAPTLVRSVAITNPTVQAYLIGRADGAPNTSLTLSASAAASCSAGSLVGGSSVGTFVVSTDAAGYFAAAIPGVNPGNFVAVQVTAPSASPTSACIANSGDNDYWPKALAFGALTSVGDYIDAPGKARWYKVSVTPGQKIQITLSGLPADYDVVVFKDIYKAFISQLVPTDTAALAKLSAEFAPSTFSPSTFSPSTFSPSTFSPDAYAPSTFSPSTFSPSVYSPSTFSPSTFSPSTFSPSTFSPSTFSPSTFSPSTFSPSTFSPSTFSPSTIFNFNSIDVQQAFSSAQTRSIIGVSATPGTGNETVLVNTWNDTGDFYVRVAGRGNASSTDGQFTLSVAKGPTSCTGVTPLPPNIRPPGVAGVKSVILTDSSRVGLSTLVPNVTLLSKLQAFAARADIGGVIVDVAGDDRVSTLKAQAAAHTACPYATNLVAEEIKSIVDSYRANNPGLRYVVIIGNDSVVPFFRYPDEALIGQESGYDPPVASATMSEASLSQDFVLSQDAYGSKTRIAMRSIDFPVPGLAVGRLVETPAEIGGMIDAYTAAGGVVNPTSSLVTGYDFLADAAGAVSSELQAGTGSAPQTLITANGVSPQDPQSWTASQLSSALFGSRHDVIFLAGHFSANSALAADFTSTLLTSDLAASATNFTNSIVFSAGCHAGYNIVDTDAIQGVTMKLDWVQAFAQKKATLIAGTGYQYGDTDFIEYSERLYKNFSRQLRAGTAGTPVSVGEALARAKLDYLAVTPDIRGIHQKAVLEATVFGLPMLGVNMPAGRSPNPVDAGVITPVAAAGNAGTLGLRIAPLSLTPATTTVKSCLKNPPFDALNPASAPVPPCPAGYTTAQWQQGADGVVSNPAEPVLPLQVVNVTPTSGVVLRGVGFVGGTYTDSTIVPLTGAPTTELRGVHTSFSSPVFFPMRLSTTNYFAAVSGTGGTKLLVTPAQHRAADLVAGTSVLRQFTGLNLRLYYSDNFTTTSLSAAPTIVSVSAATSSGGVTFAARVVGDPAAAIHDVWVTYTGGNGTWASLPLTQCSSTPPSVCGTTTDTQQWMGELASPPGDVRYIVQAVNGVGLVSADDNLGAYYSYATVPPPAASATTLALLSAPTSITYGTTAVVTAALSSSSAPVGGAPVSFSVGGTASTATTLAANGQATTTLAKVAPGTYQLVASYAGGAGYLASSASAPIIVNPAPTTFVDDSTTVAPAAFLLAGGNAQRPVQQDLVTFTVTQGATVLKQVTVITDSSGRAALPPTGLPIGTYSVSASFAGNELYLNSSLSLGSLQVTTPCPLGQKTSVRWHYSANGSPGNWSSTQGTSCANGIVAIASQAIEGDLKLAPGTTLKVGYDFNLPGNKSHFNAVITNANVVFQVSCVSGATPAASSVTVNIANQTYSLDDKGWLPSANKDDPLVYQGSRPVPDLCSGGQVRFNSGVTFSAILMMN